jgi:hypothetical protein
MSKGENIKIDQEDLDKIEANIKAPLVRVKQAIINPSFMVSIIPTNEPDTKTKPIIDNTREYAVITGEREVKVLPDLMSETKRLN